MSEYLSVLKKYATFSGRARRKEYWMFTLVNFLILAVVNILATVLNLPILLTLGSIYSLAVFIPSLAVCVRRLHDIGKCGWWVLIVLIPVIGAIWLIIMFCTDSMYGENQYGPNPKGM